jgi:tetratricopeptide (TPR) repeat protein
LKYLLDFTGVLYEAKGLYKAALKAFIYALDIDPTHVPSLISTAVVLRQLGNQSHAVVRSLLMNALRLDRTNHSAWYNLGLFYKAKGTASSSLEAAECFEAAAFLEESAPVEPFR